MQTLRGRLGPNATRIGAVASLLGAVVVLVVVLFGGGGTYEMKAAFDDVRGLIPGAPVRAGAVPVGTVQSVHLVDGTPVATMQISDDFRLHEGATADIQLFSNAGAVNRTIELTLGDPTAPRLPENATMRGPATDQPVNFDDATETLNPPTRANIRRFLIGLDAATKGRGGDLDRTLRHSSEAVNEVGNLLAQVNSDGYALKTLVRQGSAVTTALAAGPGDLASAADRTAQLLGVTAGRQAEIAQSVKLLGPSLRHARQALTALGAATPRLRRLVRDLRPAADELGPFARILPPTLRSAGPFLTETRRLVAEGPADLRAFRPIIDAAHRVTRPLGDLVNRALPLANSLRGYIPDTVGFFQNLGSSLGTYDANGHVLSLTGALTQAPPGSAVATQTGPGDCTPGHLALPYIRYPGALECQPWTDFDSSAVGAGTRSGR